MFLKKILLLLLPLLSFAIQIQIEPDQNNTLNVSEKEKNAFKQFVQEMMHVHISDKGAYRIVKENRVFANEFLKNNMLTPYDKNRIKVEIEMYLGSKFIKNMQSKIDIPDDVLYSYYLDHKDLFKKKGEVDTVLFFFTNPDKSLEFYQLSKKKNFTDIKKLAKKYGALSKDYGYRKIEDIKKPARAFIENTKKANFCLPPHISGPKAAAVLCIKDYKKVEGYESFSDTKDKIKKILYDKTFLKERNRLLQEYGIK